jgi:rhamnulokinase
MSRVILESLALRYRQVLESLESMLGRKLKVIHIVGGGSRNQVLNQFVADATGRTVVAGPAEATALGNVLVQALGSGEFASLSEARQLIRRSFPLTTVEPRAEADWEGAYERFCAMKLAARSS